MLAKWKVSRAFTVSFFAFLLFPLFFTKIHLVFFAPFLVLCYYKLSFYPSLWIALGVGVLVDLFSTSIFGLESLLYCLTTYILYRHTKRFFEEKRSTLFLMTLFFSLIFSFFQVIIYSIFDSHFTFSIGAFFTNLLIMPLFDASYSYLLFTFPFECYKIVKKYAFTKL